MGIKEEEKLYFLNQSVLCHELLVNYILSQNYVIPNTVTEAREQKEDWDWS